MTERRPETRPTRTALPRLILAGVATFALLAASGCIPQNVRFAYYFRPKVPESVSIDIKYRIGDVRVVDASHLGYQDSVPAMESELHRPASNMARQLRLRFDPRHLDVEHGLDLRIEYQESLLPKRWVPDIIPYGFPLDFPLFGMIWPVVTTSRYDVKCVVEILNKEYEVVHKFAEDQRVWIKRQEGGLLAALFVVLLPVRGDFPGTRPRPHYRYEAMSRLIVRELSRPDLQEKLVEAYERNKELERPGTADSD